MGGVDGLVNEQERRDEERERVRSELRGYFYDKTGRWPTSFEEDCCPCCWAGSTVAPRSVKKSIKKSECCGDGYYSLIPFSLTVLTHLVEGLSGLFFVRATPEESWAESAVRFYQREISPGLKRAKGVERQCKFEPSCSEYTRQAIEKYGDIRGIWMGIKRLYRCRPSSPEYGLDPVV